MRSAALDVFIHGQKIGHLIELGSLVSEKVCRFVPIADSQALNDYTLSMSFAPQGINTKEQVWKSYASDPMFTGSRGQLPVFFQNMLPEGVFRNQIAQLRQCDREDHFEILAACGKDLPGAVSVQPSTLNANQIGDLLFQGHEAIEPSVTEDPTEGAISLSGMQPKLALCLEDGRYVTRSRLGPTRIIGKMPQNDRPHLPEAELLGLQLAKSAGIRVATASLQPIGLIAGEALPGGMNEDTKFLAVERFDRGEGGKRIHCEDFAQVFSVDPKDKYKGASYAAIAKFLLTTSAGKMESLKELVRLITVNDLLGNPDGHLKNFCLVYEDGVTPSLSPAFDVVPYCTYLNVSGAALSLFKGDGKRVKGEAVFTKASIRGFGEALGLPEKVLEHEVKLVLGRAKALWPGLIAESALPEQYKKRVLNHFEKHHLITGVIPPESRPKPKTSTLGL